MESFFLLFLSAPLLTIIIADVCPMTSEHLIFVSSVYIHNRGTSKGFRVPGGLAALSD